MDHPRIIFLVSHSSPGGVQELWANLAEGFQASGADVILLALYPLPGTVTKTSASLEWSYAHPERPRSLIGFARLVRSLTGIIGGGRAATIISAMPAANVLGPICAQLAANGSKAIITHHSPVTTHNRILNKLDSIAGMLPLTSAIISVSNAVKASLKNKPRSYRDKCKVIHNALPPKIDEILKKLAENRSSMDRNKTVVSVGRLASQKNYPLLIRSATHMPAVKIKIIGSGDDEESLKQLADELGVTDRVHFLGHLAREAALEEIAKADVFVQVSLYEGHSLALIEAAKIGLPLIVSQIDVQIEGTTLENGTSAAILVPINDDENLAHNVLEVLSDDKSYDKLSRLSYQLGENSSYDKMISEYQKLLISTPELQ